MKVAKKRKKKKIFKRIASERKQLIHMFIERQDLLKQIRRQKKLVNMFGYWPYNSLKSSSITQLKYLIQIQMNEMIKII